MSFPLLPTMALCPFQASPKPIRATFEADGRVDHPFCAQTRRQSKVALPVVSPPFGYSQALRALGSDARDDWMRVVRVTENARDGETIAVRALALAALNHKDEADDLLDNLSARRMPMSKRAEIYVAVATAYLESVRKVVPADMLADVVRTKLKAMDAIVATHRALAAGQRRPYGEGDAFPYLVYAALQRRTGLGTAATALRKLDPLASSPSETKTANRIKSAP